MNRLRRLDELVPTAERQLRIVSRDQLHALGWTPHQVRHEVLFGRWHEPSPRVIAMQNADLGREQRFWLGVLHAGEGAALSHLSSAEVAGLRWHGYDDLNVITAKGDLVPPLPGFVFHQTRRRYRAWVQPGQEPTRIRVEHGALLAAERDQSLRRAIGLLAASVQQRLTTAERLLTASHEIRKLRHGSHFRLALGDIAGGAHSFAELDIGRLCDAAGLARPRRQRIRADRQGRRRYLDCEWELPDGRIIVLEIDGAFHMRTDHWWKDMRRERSVLGWGRVVLRCASVELRLEPAGVLADLVALGVPSVDRRAA